MSPCSGCPVRPQAEDLVRVILDPDLPAIPAHAGSLEARHDQRVVVDTPDGPFLGRVTLFSPPVLRPCQTPARIVREALAEDERRAESHAAGEAQALAYLRRRVLELRLEMRPLKVRFPLEGRKAIVYFEAEGRVDFRSLVRDTARRYRRRVEMRHLGVRDGAKLMGGLGPCGRPLCCSTFMTRFHSVTVRMAKRQNLSLNPTKISGMCGRLMCCLAHEVDQYPDARTARRSG